MSKKQDQLSLSYDQCLNFIINFFHNISSVNFLGLKFQNIKRKKENTGREFHI